MCNKIKNTNQLMEFCNTHKDIYVYGAGAHAKNLLQCMNSEQYSAKGIIVSVGHKKEDFLEGVLISEIKDISFESEEGVIIATDSKYYKEIFDIVNEHVNKIDIAYWDSMYPFLWKHEEVSKQSRKEGYFSKFTELQCIGEEERTDKAGEWHNFCNKYELFLRDYKEKDIVFVELGVLKGASIRMWRRYFKRAKIYGIDVDESCRKNETENISILIKDLSDTYVLEEIRNLKPNIVVDDASHLWSHQINAFTCIFKGMPSGGIYIIEDIHTSFYPLRREGIYDDNDITAYEFVEAISEVVTGNNRYSPCDRRLFPYVSEIEELGRQIEMMSFISESVIIVKR